MKKLYISVTTFVVALGMFTSVLTATVSANVGYNGQSWAACQNGYVRSSKNLYVSGVLYGNVKIYLCSNGIYTRVASNIGSVRLTAVTEQLVSTPAKYIQTSTTVGYATITNMVPSMRGYCYNGTGYIAGRPVSTGFCI